MSGPEKVYVIDPKKTSKPKDVIEELPGYLKPSASSGRTEHQEASQGERQSGTGLLLSYLAGPLSVFATRRGRKSRFWGYLAVFSVILSIIVIWMWRGLSYWSTRENPVGAIMILAASAAVISGFSAWTRAAVIAWRYEGPRLRRSPAWLRSPLAAMLFGAACPGMGLYVAGRSKRAAAVMWVVCPAIIAALVLSRSPWLWEFNSYAGAFAIRPDVLEYIFLISGAAVALGGLAWIAQVLDGARLAGRARNRKPVSRGNWAAAALLVVVIASPFLWKPAVMAEVLDRGAAVTGGKGMEILPVYLSRAAVTLDPSRPAYAVRLAGLYEGLGERAAAEEVRNDLILRLGPTISLLEEEGIVKRTSIDNDQALIPASPELEGAVQPGKKVIPAELMLLEWRIGF